MKPKQIQLSHEARRTMISNAIARCARSDGVANLSHGTVARTCTILTSESTVRRFFPRQIDLWKAAVLHPDATDSIRAQGAELGVKNDS